MKNAGRTVNRKTEDNQLRKPLLIATTNQAKLAEIFAAYKDTGIELKSLRDFPGIISPEETGETFEANAILKAQYYFSQTSLPALADDGGLIVDALDGAPGVLSNRWLGHAASDLELATAVIERMRQVPLEKRSARIGGYMAFWDGTNLVTSVSNIEGYICEELPTEIEAGFPFRSILVVSKFNKLYKDLSHAEHEDVNHRRHNLAKIRQKVISLLGF